MKKDSGDYFRAWKVLRRSMTITYCMFLLFIPTGLISKSLWGNNGMFYLFPVWFVAAVAGQRDWDNFNCPRCGHRFFVSSTWRDPFRKNCQNCRLVLWSSPVDCPSGLLVPVSVKPKNLPFALRPEFGSTDKSRICSS